MELDEIMSSRGFVKISFNVRVGDTVATNLISGKILSTTIDTEKMANRFNSDLCYLDNWEIYRKTVEPSKPL